MYMSVNHTSKARPIKAMVTIGQTITLPPVFPVGGGRVGSIIERERESMLYFLRFSQFLHFETLGPYVPSILYMYVRVH